MRLLCINAKPITCCNGQVAEGKGLKEGEIYTSSGGVIEFEWGDCYIIDEIEEINEKTKLCERFAELSDSWLDNILDSIKEEVLEEVC
jgi:hypothetical protein